MTAPMLSLPSMHTARFLVYEIPISQPSAPSRFFMASTPMLAPRQKGNWRNRQEVSLAKWLSRMVLHMDSVQGFLNRFAFLATIFVLALLIAYMTQ